jgi:tellurite resistance protein TerC
MTFWVVAGFLALIALMLAVDLGFLTRRPRVITTAEAVLSVELWLVTTLGVGLLLFSAYKDNWIPVDNVLRVEREPYDAWVQFLSSYLVEIALSLDNIAVLALMLAHFGVDEARRSRMLFWVFLSCLILRAGLIAGGASVLHMEWTRWVFVGLLSLAAVRTFVMPDRGSKLENKSLVRVARWLTVPSRDGGPGGIFARVCDWLNQSPLAIVVLVAAAADLSFALDSIPAVFSMTRDPLIAFTSNTLAILSLRSLYFALAGVIGRLRYLRLGVVFVLVGLAVKTAFFHDELVPTLATLAGVLLVMALSVGASIPAARRQAAAEVRPTPLEDVSEAVALTRRNLRKLVVLTAGTVVLIAAVVIGILPGPGFVILAPIGIAILATEFVWARSLISKLKTLQDRTDHFAQKSSIWMVPLAIIGFWAGIGTLAYLLHEYKGVSVPLVLTLTGGGFLPVGFWAYRRTVLWWNERHAPPRD